MSDDAFLPLSKPLLTHKNTELPSDLLAILNSELRSTLTLRSLFNLCVACKVKKPTAQMLAFALQNSIPGLTGLPMDKPDPAFYIKIAKRFYDKAFASIEHKVNLRIHNYFGRSQFFPAGTNLYARFDEGWPRAMDYYVRVQIDEMSGLGLLGTREGRKMANESMLKWKKHYEGHGPQYQEFIDLIVRILDHGFVFDFRFGAISAGRSALSAYEWTSIQ
jgi:hypothetical protein